MSEERGSIFHNTELQRNRSAIVCSTAVRNLIRRQTQGLYTCRELMNYSPHLIFNSTTIFINSSSIFEVKTVYSEKWVKKYDVSISS